MAGSREPNRFTTKKGQVVVVLSRAKASHVPFKGTYAPCVMLLKPGCPTLVSEATALSLIEATSDVRIAQESTGYFPERIYRNEAAA